MRELWCLHVKSNTFPCRISFYYVWNSIWKALKDAGGHVPMTSLRKLPYSPASRVAGGNHGKISECIRGWGRHPSSLPLSSCGCLRNNFYYAHLSLKWLNGNVIICTIFSPSLQKHTYIVGKCMHVQNKLINNIKLIRVINNMYESESA